MALLTVQSLFATGGALFVPVAAAGGGDTMPCTGKELLYVKNASGGSINVTIVAQNPCSFGVSNVAHDRVVAVAAGAEKFIPLDDAGRFANASGIASITYSAAASVTVAACRAT